MLETERLVLDQWCEADFAPFAQLNADPEVMRYFLAPLSAAESDALARRIHNLIVEQGYGFWALRLKETGQFIGFTGLHHKDGDSGIPNAPLVEIGWRLSAEFWGKGYAPEAARAALRYAFTTLELGAVYAFTALPNRASRRVMEKIGMEDTGEDFDHPDLPEGHWLERHCLYRITRI
ncbi:MAG: GNAT family N-acetyltransferase [Thiolinea sp.]